jgi:hypothetical protein
MSGLRNEHYVAFLDESGEPGLQVVAGIFVPASWLRAAERRWREFIRGELGSQSGKLEVKGRELIKGEAASIHAQRVQLARGGAPLSAKGAGRQFYRLALEHIAHITELRVLTVGVKTKYAEDAYRAWFWLAYAALTTKPRYPRPFLPITVIDGEDQAFREAQSLIAHRFYKSFKDTQPYLHGGRGWFVGGSALHESMSQPFIQMADLVAGAGRHAIAGRKGLRMYYSRNFCDVARKRGRRIDIGSHALDEIRRLSPDDACGSGWADVLLAR